MILYTKEEKNVVYFKNILTALHLYKAKYS